MRIVERGRSVVHLTAALACGVVVGCATGPVGEESVALERLDASVQSDLDAAANDPEPLAPEGDAAVDSGTNLVAPGHGLDDDGSSCALRSATTAGPTGLEDYGPWVRTAVLTPDAADACLAESFGDARAVAQDLIVVGSSASLAGAAKGAAYVFERHAAGWVRQAKLVGAGGTFGWSVAIAGDAIVVGDPTEPCGGEGASPSGAARIYVREGAGWTQRERLIPADLAGSPTRFGEALAADGNTLAIGAPAAPIDVGPTRSGAVYVFVHGGSNRALQARLVATLSSDTPSAATQLGAFVSVSGDWLVSGAHQAAFAYARAGDAWTQHAALAMGDRDHWAVSMSGESVLVGAACAPGDAYGPPPQCAGAAQVWRRDADGWQEEATLLPSLAAAVPDDDFGCRVVLAGDLAVVERCHDSGDVRSFVFERDADGWWEQARFARGGAALSPSGDTLVLSGPGAPGQAREAWVFERR
jgi:hypothetical protein